MVEREIVVQEARGNGACIAPDAASVACVRAELGPKGVQADHGSVHDLLADRIVYRGQSLAYAATTCRSR